MRATAERIPDLGLRCVLVAMGGAVGVSLRGFAEQCFEAAALPGWEAVMVCNLLGSVLIGAFYAALDAGFPRPVDARVLPGDLPNIARKRELLASFAMTGLLGGLTTFSTVSLDTVHLIEGGRLFEAAFSVLGSLLLGLAGIALGVTLQRWRYTRHHPELR
ncbi:MAG: CrcB family protein [Myxococcota bacterium]|nr:CrcB family protein [bacterium]MDP6075291.1 CrcB family protein [Myxococcota bacterium]MDP6243691.1 CrcB family protein [Myxococcota bacterium]MDP7074884.1 CrcB family protein [Myxococcota bacterium]MDP7301352.1 CrcB family protein [Myxococcota bacterium]